MQDENALRGKIAQLAALVTAALDLAASFQVDTPQMEQIQALLQMTEQATTVLAASAAPFLPVLFASA